MRRPAVFLDRDGTILTERAYLTDPAKMRFYAGVFAAMRSLKEAGFRLVIITNQSAVARGMLTLKGLDAIHRKFRDECRRRGVSLDGIYFCPHAPDAGCSCRKPAPALPRRAARDLSIDLRASFVVGDQARDVELARNIGGRGLLVLTGGGRSARAKALKAGGKITSNLATAARHILSSRQLGKFPRS